MKKLSMQLLANTVVSRRKDKKITQAQLSKVTGINRGLLSRLESRNYVPSIEQLEALGEALNFDPTDMFVDTANTAPISVEKSYRIAVAGTGYVGLSLAVLLAQHNQVTAVDIIPEKVEKILGDKERIQWFAAKFANIHDAFFIGRGIDYAVSMEGSLKLKEISYKRRR